MKKLFYHSQTNLLLILLLIYAEPNNIQATDHKAAIIGCVSLSLCYIMHKYKLPASISKYRTTHFSNSIIDMESDLLKCIERVSHIPLLFAAAVITKYGKKDRYLDTKLNFYNYALFITIGERIKYIIFDQLQYLCAPYSLFPFRVSLQNKGIIEECKYRLKGQLLYSSESILECIKYSLLCYGLYKSVKSRLS
jgi:hypothetical protein